MLPYSLIIIGAVFAILGIIFFVKGIGAKAAAKIKFLGLEFESKSSSLIIFVVGAALIAFGAYNANNSSSTNSTHDIDNTSNTNNTANKSVTTPDKPSDSLTMPGREAVPLKEFTLTSGQQQVFNDLKVTFTLINKPWNEAERTVTIRIWRQITKPLSDTAYLDPAGGQPGTVNQLFKVDNITPVSIPDVGDYKILITGLEVRNGVVGSVLVRMFRN